AMAEGPEVVGWHVPWDGAAGDRALRENAEVITGVSTFSYTLSKGGRIVKTGGARPQADARTARELGMEVVPTIANEFDPTRVQRMLSTPGRRRAHAAAISRLVNRNGFDG